jgi:hypothetical protein
MYGEPHPSLVAVIIALQLIDRRVQIPVDCKHLQERGQLVVYTKKM